MTEEEARRRAQEITDEINVSTQTALGSIEQAKTEARRVSRRDGYFWLIMIVTALGSAALAIAYSAHNTNQSELKFCTVVDSSVRQNVAKLETYRREPPTTPAGIAQQKQAAVDVAQSMDLQRSLGCPMTKDDKK